MTNCPHMAALAVALDALAAAESHLLGFPTRQVVPACGGGDAGFSVATYKVGDVSVALRWQAGRHATVTVTIPEAHLT